MLATRTFGVVLAAALALTAPTSSGAAAVQVGRSDSGLSLTANGAPLDEVLHALAEREGFTVVMQDGLERPPVEVEVRDATLEEVLRKVLLRRNYAIAYDADGEKMRVSRVEVLLPRSTPSTTEVATRAREDARRRALLARQLARESATERAARERAERRQNWQKMVEARRAAQARTQAAQQVSVEPVPLRRQLWGRTR